MKQTSSSWVINYLHRVQLCKSVPDKIVPVHREEEEVVVVVVAVDGEEEEEAGVDTMIDVDETGKTSTTVATIDELRHLALMRIVGENVLRRHVVEWVVQVNQIRLTETRWNKPKRFRISWPHSSKQAEAPHQHLNHQQVITQHHNHHQRPQHQLLASHLI